MQWVRTFVIATAVGLASALLGWLIAIGLGTLAMHAPALENNVGAGVVFVIMLYLLSFVFGVVGFSVSLVRMFRNQRRTRASTDPRYP